MLPAALTATWSDPALRCIGTLTFTALSRSRAGEKPYRSGPMSAPESGPREAPVRDGLASIPCQSSRRNRGPGVYSDAPVTLAIARGSIRDLDRDQLTARAGGPRAGHSSTLKIDEPARGNRAQRRRMGENDLA